MSTALASALFHFLWQGAAIAFLLAVFCLVVKAPRLRYAAACGAMVAMATAFIATLLLKNTVSIPLGFGAAPPRTVVALWMVGTSVIYLYRFAGWVAVQRLRRHAVCLAPADWRERLSALARRIGSSERVMLLESALAETPLAFGLWKPVILMPAGLLMGLPASQVEAILLHELAHIARHDYLVNLMQAAIEGLLFYHPAVWWVSYVVRRERELCCDDIVVAVTGDRTVYAQALTALEHHRAQLALASTGGPLMYRIHRLLGRRSSRLAAAAPAVVFLIVAGAAALIALPQQQQPAPPVPQPAQQTVPPPIPAAAPVDQPAPARAVAPGLPATPIATAPMSEPAADTAARGNAFERMAQIVNLQRVPDVRFTDLQQILDTNAKHDQIPVQVEVSYFPLTETSTTATVTLKFDRSGLQFRQKDGLAEAGLDVYLRLTTETGRRVGVKELPMFLRGPADQLASLSKGTSLLTHSWTLSPGRYKLMLAVKDVVSEHLSTGEATIVISQSEVAMREPAESPYERWLQQDVIWIITDAERRAFGRLQTDDERQMFIEQFWLRRDPTPGTDENEIKEEHYRRLAWANERFKAQIPGWKTDRGMVYVKYGAPDEKEEHPTGGPAIRPIAEGGGETVFYPYEKWRYRFLPDIGENVELEFVDQDRNNEYRMTWNPNDKDALLTTPGAGLTLYERLGLASKEDRQREGRLRGELEGPYKKWLESEADWIIVAERAAFPEVRRDAAPGTDEYESREEHYRRIAWSNERFSEGTLPGFQSIRGRVYVRFGPPDKTETLEGSGRFANTPLERWQYSRLEGVGSDVAIDFVKTASRYKILIGDDRPGERELYDLLLPRQ